MKRELEAGFTLIEILIAVVILGLMMISVYGIINNSTQTKDIITNEDRSLMQVQAAISRFELDFSSVVSPLFYSVAKESNPQNQIEADTLSDTEVQPFVASENFFATTESGELLPTFQMPDSQTLIFFSSSHHRRLENAKQARYNWVRYHLRDSTQENELGEKIPGKELVRSTVSEDIYRPEIDWSQEKEFILLNNIKEFKWSFWDREKENFVDTVRELTNPNMIPRLIQMSFVWIAPDQTEMNFLRSFRPLYPYFDTKAEADAIKAKKAANAAAGEGQSTSFGADSGEVSPPVYEGDDEI